MPGRRKPLLSVEKEPEKRRLEKEREHSLHGQSLSDDRTGHLGETGPVCAELELHGDAGHDAHREVESKDASPESGRGVGRGIVSKQSQGFEKENEKSEAHRELGEEIVVRDRKCEMQTMEVESGIQETSWAETTHLRSEPNRLTIDLQGRISQFLLVLS